MAALFTAADLRALADALDALTETTGKTRVTLGGYNHGEITLQDHVIRVQWRDPDDLPDHATYKDAAEAARGAYTVEFPDPS